MNYIKIAWRNLWRNRKRTFITSSSILFAVFFVVVMRSFQLGSYNNMIQNTIESYMGFMQIQHADYQYDMSIDNSFEYDDDFLPDIESKPGIKAVVPRIETFALASTGAQTKGVIVIGVDPVKEKSLSNPAGKLVRYRIDHGRVEKLNSAGMPGYIIEKFMLLIGNSYISAGGLQSDLKLTKEEAGRYMPAITDIFTFEGNPLMPGDDGILVSDRLAKFLRATPGDTLILMGQGYHGVSAAGLFPIKGIIKIPAPDLDNKLIYMPLEKAQELYSMQGRLTSIAINLHNNSDKEMNSTKLLLASQLTENNMTIKTWKEFNKVLFQQIQSDNQSGQIILGLLYFIVLFGIFGTVLMMIHERRREFGIMISIGMKKIKLALIITLEMLLMGLMGVVSGVLLSLPFLYIGNRYPIRFTGDMARIMEDLGFEPIMPLEWIDNYILWQGLIVALMVILSCLYPLRKIFKLKEIEALRA